MCNADRHRYETRFETTVQDERTDVRASDAERDAVVESLRGHAQAGRLTPEELEEAVELALAAMTRDDLAALQRDLPAPARRVHERPRTRHRHSRGRPPF